MTDQIEIPCDDSVWQHTNGNRYQVVLIANNNGYKTDKYPQTVVYRNVSNRRVFSHKLSDWHRSMTFIADDVCEHEWKYIGDVQGHKFNECNKCTRCYKLEQR